MALTAGVPRAPKQWPLDLRQFTAWIRDAFTDVISGTLEVTIIGPIATNTIVGRATAGSGQAEEITCTAAGRNLLDDVSASAQRATLGLGTSAIVDTGTSGAKTPLLSTANTWTLVQTFSAPPIVPTYTVAGVPSATPAGQLVYISNETGGATLAFSDATNWRRVSDRAVIA